MLVIANQTIVEDELLAAIGERAAQGPVHFTLVAPSDEPGSERRLARSARPADEAGLDASGHLGDPDPFTAALNALHDEPIDEIVVSTFPNTSSGWLRRDLIQRLSGATSLPVRHVVDAPAREPRSAHERGRRSSRTRPRRPPARGASELAGQPRPARDLPLHRLRGDALRVVLRRLLLRTRLRRPGDVAARALPRAGLPRWCQHDHPRHVELHRPLGDSLDSAPTTGPGSSPASG